MSDYAASVQAVGLRISKLDSAGAPATTATSSYTTKAFTKFHWTPQYEQGQEIKTVAADGTVCVYYQMPDTLKSVDMELEICNPQPEVYEMLGGGAILVGPAGTAFTISNKALTTNVATLTTTATHTFLVGDRVVVTGVDATFNGTYTITAVTATTFSYAKVAANVTSGVATGSASKGDNTGWASPATGTVVNPNGVSIEIWSRAIVGGKPASVNPYWRWVMPYQITRLTGDRVLENGQLASVFSGTGQANPNWNDGPANDWQFGSNSALLYARDTAAVSTEGYFTVLP